VEIAAVIPGKHEGNGAKSQGMTASVHDIFRRSVYTYRV